MSQYMLETEEDMLAYFDVDFGHAINATYIRSGVSTAIKIILNREYVEQDAGIGVEATKPIAYCRSIDVPNVSQGDLLNASATTTVEGDILKAAQNYTIIDVQKDRTGLTALMLEEA